MVDLGTRGGRSSSAYAVNDHGLVVGYSLLADDQGHAFSWTESRGMVDLGTIGGTFSLPLAVNNSGQVVGYSTPAGAAYPAYHATLWNPGYRFEGFFQSPPAFNRAPANGAVSVRFSLHGDWGLEIFGVHQPFSVAIPCESGDTLLFKDAQAAVGALAYKGETDRYAYAWRVDPAWRGTCRQLVMRLDDGTTHAVNFFFAVE